MVTYRLSLRAEQTLEYIIGWTIDHFGLAQAVKYKDQLIARLSFLALDEVPHGWPCNVLLAGKRDVGDLEYCRDGRHYINYRNTDEGIFVLDFIHGSRNLAVIIEDLSE